MSEEAFIRRLSDQLTPGRKPRRDPTPRTRYSIVRFYSPMDGRPNEVIREGLTLKQAQKHCSSPKTRKDNVFFDGYREE